MEVGSSASCALPTICINSFLFVLFLCFFLSFFFFFFVFLTEFALIIEPAAATAEAQS